jgi:hypothetical protein
MALLNVTTSFVLIGVPLATKEGDADVTVGAAPGGGGGGDAVGVLKMYAAPSDTATSALATSRTTSFFATIFLPSLASKGAQASWLAASVGWLTQTIPGRLVRMTQRVWNVRTPDDLGRRRVRAFAPPHVSKGDVQTCFARAWPGGPER